MNESHHHRNQVIPIKLRPIPKIDKIPLNNLNLLKEKLKIDVAPYVTKNTKFQDLLTSIQTHKNKETTPTRAFVSHKATRRHSIFEAEHTEASTCNPDTHNTSIKSKESSKLPNIKYNNTPNQKQKNRGGVTLSVGNSSVFNNTGSDSDKDKTPARNYVRAQSPQSGQRDKGKMTIDNQSRDIENCHMTTIEANPNLEQRRVSAADAREARPVSRRTISVDRAGDIAKAFACNQQPEPLEDKNRTIEQEYKTLTSVYDSNQSLIDFRAGEDDDENSFEIIRGVVAKHVEATYRNINIIKKNFQRKSRTYLFYIPKNI